MNPGCGVYPISRAGDRKFFRLCHCEERSNPRRMWALAQLHGRANEDCHVVAKPPPRNDKILDLNIYGHGIPLGRMPSRVTTGQGTESRSQSLSGTGQGTESRSQSLSGTGQRAESRSQSLSGTGQRAESRFQSLSGTGQAFLLADPESATFRRGKYNEALSGGRQR